MRRKALWWVVFAACILLHAIALSEETNMAFSFNGVMWGMSKEEVRSLLDFEPFQEPTAQTGHSALVYQMLLDDTPCIIQYNFLPSDALYNITIMSPDAEKSFYSRMAETFTSLYSSPLTAKDASMESDDAAAVMIAALMQSSADTDFLGWNADQETVIILSFEPAYKVCYVEMRRYTDYFRFSSD